ncbi:putative sulfoacetate transporter SauU [Roseovarius litorisediminis]|uniref:Putative sulfoacetate transporter SauU n=1 Tax=Roseovarius litorisediminis TaxID=1312363 RepID=A0A1Y5RSA3_9RHOB|nr:MFS transporter [Roseovarius litorisediminis]SLN24221.1 putative sulfoacetate transporter SauU [Roseovarius litorisediminis]
MNDHLILDSRYAWSRLALSLFVAMIGSAGMWANILVMPAIQAEFAVDRADASLPYTLTMIGFAFGNLVIGRVVDRFGIAFALILSALIIGAGMGLSVFSPTVEVLAGLQFVIGFGSAATFGPLMADVSQWFLKRRGIAVGITASGNYLAGALWPLVLTGVMTGYGWRAVYLVLVIATLALMVPLALGLKRRVPLAASAHSDRISGERASATGIPPRVMMLMLALAGVGCCVAMSMPQVHIVAYCVDLGYGPAVGSKMLSLMLAAGVVSRLVSGVIADKLGGVRTLLIGSGLQCLALFLYLPAGGMVSLYVVSLVFGLSQGGIVPSYTLIVREYMPSAEAGRRVGFVLMATISGMAIGGWMSGWIYDVTGSYQMAFLNGIAWNFLNIGIMLLILTRTRPRQPKVAAA